MFHSSGIKSLQRCGMCILVITLEGNFYVLLTNSLFPVSQLIGFHLQFVTVAQYFHSLHPLLLFIQDDGTNQHFYTSYLTFGTPKLIAEEWISPIIHMTLNETIPIMICVHPNTSSFTLHLFLLTASTHHQHFLRLLQEHRLEDALVFARQHSLDTSPVYRRQLQQLLKQWKDLPHSDWLNAPPINCDNITAVLDIASPSLIFYVLSSEYLPSAATCEMLLQYAEKRCQDDETKSQMIECQRRWNLFRHVMRLEKEGSVRVWQVIQQLTLSELQSHFLKRGLVSTVQEMWRMYQNDSSLQAEEMRSSVIKDVVICITERQSQSLSIQQTLIQWMQKCVLNTLSEDERRRFLEWVCEFIQKELQRLQEDMTQEVHILAILLHNLQQLASMVSEFPLINDDDGMNLLMKAIHYEGYLKDLSELILTYHLSIIPSPSAELPSNEELVVRMLNNLQNVELLQLELECRVKPFCRLRNMSTDEVFSYYLQQDLENVKEIEMRRVRVLWNEIQNGDLRVEALKGLMMRSPPYDEGLQELMRECAERVSERMVSEL